MLLPYAKCQTVLEAIVPFSNRRDGLSGCGVKPYCSGVAGREQIEPVLKVCRSKWLALRSAAASSLQFGINWRFDLRNTPHDHGLRRNIRCPIRAGSEIVWRVSFCAWRIWDFLISWR